MKRIIPIILFIAIMLYAGDLWAFLAGIYAIRTWRGRNGTIILIANLIAGTALLWMLLWITHSILMTHW